MWTHFWDMNSGGGQKLQWGHIFIEAPEDEAVVIFYNRFGRNPHRVTCTCCGSDYSISEDETLEQATAYQRGCAYDNDKKQYIEEARTSYGHTYKFIPIDEFLATGETSDGDNALVIRAEDIKPEERLGSAPEEGYVWM